jgi:hypothetical protein
MTSVRNIRTDVKVLKNEIAPPSQGRLFLTVHGPRDLTGARLEESLARLIGRDIKVLKNEIAPPSQGRLSLTVHGPRDLTGARLEESLARLIGPDWRHHDVIVWKRLLVNEAPEIVSSRPCFDLEERSGIFVAIEAELCAVI